MKFLLVLCFLLLDSVQPAAIHSQRADDVLGAEFNLRRIRPAVESKIRQANQQVKETLDRVKRVDIADMLKKDFRELKDEFLPGLVVKPKIILLTFAILVCSTIWLVSYFAFLYESDRCEHLAHWGIADTGKPDKAVAEPTPDPIEETLVKKDINPDLVIVFHHPSYEGQSDRNSAFSSNDVRGALVAEVASWRVLASACPVRATASEDGLQLSQKQEGDVIRGHAVDGWVALESEPGYAAVGGEDGGPPQLESLPPGPTEGFGAFRSVVKDASELEHFRSPLAHLKRARETLGSAWSSMHANDGAKEPTFRMARTALLQDLFAQLPRWGFSVSIFSSIDDDELYVCISLEDPVAVEQYLLRTGTLLQIKQDVVPRLGINQPRHEVTSSPPFLRYDPRIVKNLYEAGIIDADDPRELFRTHYGKNRDGCIVKSSDRFQMIFRQISAHLDLDSASRSGLIATWYPAHSRKWLDKLSKSWGNFTLLKDASFVQPIPLVHDYFGARVAFIFAWNGFYCKSLFALSILAILMEGFAYFCVVYHSHDGATIRKRVVLAFSVVTVIWARLAKNLWAREQEYFLSLWETSPETTEPIRPSFAGEKMASPADLNLMEKQFPGRSATLRRFCSTLITLAFCIVVGCCILVWTQIFEGRLDLVASISLSLMILVFQQVYNLMVPRLTEWENHKYQSTYYDSYVLKQFVFESVNRYCAFFFLAVKQRHTDAGCPEGGCMNALNQQLWMTLLILSLTRIAQIIVASVIVRLKIMWEDYQLKQTRADGQELPERSFVELQSKFSDSRLQEQIDAMMQLALALGFVLLFGPVAPIIVPFSLAVFLIQLRGSAYMMVKFSKRSIPRHQYGIGIWGGIVQTVMNGSLLFSGFLIVVYGDLFAGTPLLTKVAGIAVYVLCMELVWLLVDVAYPPFSEKIDVLTARRRRVKTVLLERATDFSAQAGCDGQQGTSPRMMKLGSRVQVDLADVVGAGSWSEIPHMQDCKFIKQ